MKKTLLILGVAAGVLFASCGQSGETNTVATDEAGQAAESVTVEKTIDLSASSVQWTGRKILDGMHTGTVAISQGSIAMNGSAIESGNFVLDMSTLKEKNGSDEAMTTKLLGHLSSPDFFDVASYPTASFVITEGGSETIKGNLTIKDVTNQIEIPVQITETAEGTSVSSTFTINRNDWGVTWGNNSTNRIDFLKDNFIKDEIEFVVNLVATK